MRELSRLHTIQPAGLAAIRQRNASRSNPYFIEQDQDKVRLASASEKALKESRNAWDFFKGLALKLEVDLVSHECQEGGHSIEEFGNFDAVICQAEKFPH